MKTRAIRGAGIAAALSIALLASTPAHADECTREDDFDIITQVVYFDFNSAEISPEDQGELKDLVDQYNGNPALAVCVLGQADLTGSGAFNEELALRRANAVADFMKMEGLQANKLEIVSRGQSIADDSLLEDIFGGGFEHDRRVEVMMMIP